ncbi:response regulator [Falsiroseomonas sp. HW251]|uniref:response regulator n=1 Tax=Falsiroseomonas sp. HW251 TaxID=3390998 RepID=UPI003D31B815
MTAFDRDMLEAFVPEFEAAAARLAAADDAGAATRAIGQLRAMAEAMEARSLRGMLDAAALALDPLDLPALRNAAAALAAQARAIGEVGGDLDPPAAPAAPEASPPAAAAPTPAPDGPRRRVLVVDDSPMMRRLVREIIGADPAFELVGEAADGRAGLAAIAALRPDLILLDIEMPELDGIGVLRHWTLRGVGAVVVVSSAVTPGSATAVEARRLGAAGIVAKPSGALSPDLRERQGATLRRAARRAAGLPEQVGA